MGCSQADEAKSNQEIPIPVILVFIICSFAGDLPPPFLLRWSWFLGQDGGRVKVYSG